MTTQQKFDQHGRCIPNGLHSAANELSRRYFLCDQPEIDYDEIYDRVASILSVQDGFTVEDFKTRAQKIIAELQSDVTTENITKGVCIPFFVPVNPDLGDIGAALENQYLPGVGRAYAQKLPEYEFTNQHKEKLDGSLTIIEGSRHERFIDALKTRTVVGVFCPCMTEYSIPASVEKIAQLPEKFLLTGGIDLCAVFIAAPDLLIKVNNYPPTIWFSALATSGESAGLHFEAYGYNLNLYRRAHLDHAAEYWWNGVTVLG